MSPAARTALECGGVISGMAVIVGLPIALFGGWGAIAAAVALIALFRKLDRRS
ncbi:hypothetical protein [Herbiconiux sp. VKM Ac-2851]|uniref:hypothetical protein n=1 Tax=Herbiconiux sp. VKM Ac-2851 TaxID=2739025 RepID=UPI00156311B3|nr:hypothetical protein [Herbiconiux sp. VKM Ac-2851]NQX36287.1 hypothetical protein [Herbiconiux sp. VKM Ac-2851]